MGSDASKEINVSCNQINAEWKIKKFSAISNKKENNLDSPPFSVNGEEWFLQLRDGVDSCRWIGLYLVRKCSLPQTIRVVFSVGIRNADGSVYKISYCDHSFDAENNKYGKYTAKLSELLILKETVTPDDILTVFCNARLVSEDVPAVASQTDSTDGVYTLAQNLNDLLLSGTDADFKFKVKNREFRTHRSILGARSPVFRSMFKNDMKEKSKGVANINEYDPEAFQDFLTFIYSGNVSHVTIVNAPVLYKIADKYDVIELKAECLLRMSRDMSVDSFFEAVIIATLYNEEELLKTVTQFLADNLKNVLRTPKWMSFMIENPAVANDLLLGSASKK